MEPDVLTAPLKLVTIVGEAILAERLPGALRHAGATGWTLTPATGDGSRGMRTTPLPGDNMRIETVVSEPVADRILASLAAEYFPNFAIVAWVSDVHVVRGEKYRGDGASRR
jgi:nitrogen regulatory protein P-II 2